MQRREALKLIMAMERELKRSMKHLKAPGHPRPYYTSYLLRDTESFNVWARYGAAYQDRKERKRNCFVDVRVGSYRYDHTTKGGLSESSDEQDSPVELSELPIETDEDSFRFCLWRLSDAKFRDAVARYHGKKSRDVSYLDQNRSLSSFSRLPRSKLIKPIKSFQVEEKKWRSLVKAASLSFKQFPEIKNSYVEFNAELVTKIFVNTEGVVRLWQEPLFSLTAYFWYHTPDLDQDMSLVYHVAKPDDIPSLAKLKKEILAKVGELKKVAQGDEMTSYAGPVLLAPKVAGLFLHEVLGHRLEGTRLLSESEGRTFRDKLGHKIMHEQLSIIDDPSLKSWQGRSLVAHYPFDDEGAPSQPALLVEKGVLRGFLSTRSPIRAGQHQSNGHARNQNDERPISRMANFLVLSHSSQSFSDLKQQLLAEIKRRKLPFGMMLLDVEGGETETEAYNFQAFLGQIVVAIKVYPDGREQYVKGVDFVGTPLSSLHHIIGVSQESELDNGYCGAESGTIPVSTVSPALLLSNLELQAKNPSKVTQYILPLPWSP